MQATGLEATVQWTLLPAPAAKGPGYLLAGMADSFPVMVFVKGEVLTHGIACLTSSVSVWINQFLHVWHVYPEMSHRCCGRGAGIMAQ